MNTARYLQALIILMLSVVGLNWPIAYNHQQPSQQQQHSLAQNLQSTPGHDDTVVIKPVDDCNGSGSRAEPLDVNVRDREGFHFENPSTDCIYVTQMHIWDSFKDLEKDINGLFKLVHKDVNFTVVGHYPIAGNYNDLLHLYVNALRRVGVLFKDYADKFEIHPLAIHGGCNERWSVQEVQFKGVMNSGKHSDRFPVWKSHADWRGDPFEIVNIWVTRWHRDQMVEIRTYVDTSLIMEVMHRNEVFWNGTAFGDNVHYIPGPMGMPNMTELEELLGYPNGSKYGQYDTTLGII